jgi:putative peptidoglycan lipid II flippase
MNEQEQDVNIACQNNAAGRTTGSKKAALMMSCTGGVQMILSMATGMLAAKVFGAGANKDAYDIGTYIPMVLMCFFGLDLMRAIFVATFSRLDIDKKEEPSEVFSSIMTILVMLSVFVIAFGIILSPAIVKLIAPDIKTETTEIAVKITRIAMPSMLLMMIGSMSGAVLLAHRRYFKSQMYDLVSRAVLTTAAVLCIFTNSIYFLAIGFVAGQLIASVVAVKQVFDLGLRYRPQIKFSPVVKSIMWQSIPVWVGVVAIYFANTMQNRYASRFEAGSIASLRYTVTIFSAVSILVSVPLFRALSPRIARCVALNNLEEEKRLFWTCFRQACCITVIATTLILLCATEIVTVIFKRGVFDDKAVGITSSLFIWYGLAIWGNIISYQANAIMFAHKKTVMIMIQDLVSNGVLCLLLILLIEPYGLQAVAIAFGISHIVRGIVSVLLVLFIVGIRTDNIAYMWLWTSKFLITSVLSIAVLFGYTAIFGKNISGFYCTSLYVSGAIVTISGVFAAAGYFIKLSEVLSVAHWIKTSIPARLKRQA